MKQIVLIAFLLIGLGGCTKFGKNITVKGRILNPVTGEGIANIQIQIVREDGGLPGGYKEVKSTYTDSEGNFEISKLGLFQNYYIQAQVPDYSIGWKENGEPKGDFRAKIAKRHVVEMDYHTVPYGSLKLNIYNISCLGATDTLILERNSITIPQYGGFIPITLTGCYSAVGVPTQIPMGYWEIKWTVIKNSITTNFSDTILVNELGITDYTINY